MNVFYATSPQVIKNLRLSDFAIVFVSDTYQSKFSSSWDDFGYKTTCQVFVVDGAHVSSIGYAKMLLEDAKHTHIRMREIIGERKYIALSAMEIDYLTLAEDREFYLKLSKIVSHSNIDEYFFTARDAGYIKLYGESDLFESKGFEDSLLREMGARKALEYAKKVHGYAAFNDIEFDVRYNLDSYDGEHTISFDFTDGFYPANINLLIGANGTGKTQGLFTLMQDMLDVGESRRRRKESIDSSLKPFFTNIVCFSYSPFEDISTVAGRKDVRSSSIFQPFGFYRKGEFNKDSPLITAVESLFEIIRKDQEDGDFDIRPSRISSLLDIMGIGIPGFDDLGIVVPTKKGRERVIPAEGDYEKLLKYESRTKKECGVIYLKDGERLKLSSGQSMFSTLVVGALSHIKKETLLVFDEPELYLHPSLEIVLLQMLRTLLEKYDSYAVISTHSLVLAREVPTRCTSVLKRREGVPVIGRPPFETFGASMDRINSYVFDDAKGHKKYHDFLDQEYKKYGGFEKTMDARKSELNEESILYLMGKE
ncbi:AAA family ATPase [Pseudodesulfovibrio thermohalotolerans]|uniref:AAA family ATPase n=1 Tax=Pseudodesulfovibrio thermohalotolerans TaxID=2880651 RepID=UPI002442EBF6|nr:AAA family ATPase [Pseudodesulfovibrio thermohalotolerans]WFS62316.1 AAA family ATPase [Pseudodesulfovibrio thermohalotolerans]